MLDHFLSNAELVEELARLRRQVEALSGRQAQTVQRHGDDAGRLWAVFLATPDAVFVKDKSLHYTLVNPSAERFFGRSAGEMTGRTDQELFGADAVAAWEDADEQALAGQLVERADARLVEGVMRSFQTLRSPLRSASGETTGVLGVARDVSALRREAAGLRDVCERMERGVTAAGLALWDADFITGRVSLSGGWAETLGPAGGTEGVTWVELVHPDDYLTIRDALAALADGRASALEAEVRLRVKAGGWAPALALGRPTHRAPGGRALRGAGALIDTSLHREQEAQRRRAEARLMEQERQESLATLAGGMAHDFNNLLASVLGNTELALMKLAPDAAVRRHLTEIQRSASQAAGLVRHMTAYAGRDVLNVERLDLSEIARQARPLVETLLPRNVSLNLRLSDGLPPVEGDAAQLRHVVVSLVTNAAEAIESLGPEAGGAITVSTGLRHCDEACIRQSLAGEGRPAGVYACLSVEDTGCGMDAATLRRVFEPFFSTKFIGRGLGLAATMGIVRAHKGVIQARSTPGQGSVFTILLPVAAAEPRPESAPPAPARKAQPGGAVLAVDDEPAALFVLENMLRRRGRPVFTARDGAEAVKVFHEHASEIACAVLDLTMPHMDGDEALAAMRKIRPDLPAIISSGHADFEVARRFAGADGVRLFHKPYTYEQLSALLDEVMGVNGG